MRLLELTDDDGFRLIEDREEDELPPYAILSHTWGPDAQEVTFKDLNNGTGNSKSGYRKLEFCARQTRRDGLCHFWADTCCIDKTNNVELNTAIVSMFRWYQQAAKCYVYLADVTASSEDNDVSDGVSWESDFRGCRWLTRGWTLQELLAPAFVDFFDREGVKLGNKASLERHLCDTTGIPAEALRGRQLSSFTVEERFSWQTSRTTKKSEDRAYSLMGVCGVSMVPIYGEGRENASARLRREIKSVYGDAERQSFAIPFGLAGVTECLRFAGREQELDQIHRSLRSDGSRRIVVLQGPSGIGKTQTALAYAKRHQYEFSAIFWLSVEDNPSLNESFREAFKCILRYQPTASSLSKVNPESSLDKIVAAVKGWLGQTDNTRWLVIFDQHDDRRGSGDVDQSLAQIHDSLPLADQGSVIVTTRSSKVGVEERIAIRNINSTEEAVRVLSSVSRRSLSAEDSDVISLAQRLQGLPINLAIAGAFLNHETITVADFLRLYDTAMTRVQEDRPDIEVRENEALYSCLYVSIDGIRQRDGLAAKLLKLWCYFSNKDLWHELLCDGSTETLPWTEEVMKSPHAFSGAMRVLVQYGLASVEPSSKDSTESAGYSIHHSVHLWAINTLNAQWDNASARFAIGAIGRHVPDEHGIEPWIMRRRLPHVDRCDQYLSEESILGLEGRLIGMGSLYKHEGKIEKATLLYKKALDLGDTVRGSDRSSVSRIMNDLGHLYFIQRNLDAAEEMFEEALVEKKKVLGPNDFTLFVTMHNLGNVYLRQGELARAERMCTQALEGIEKAMGPDHLSTLLTVENFGHVYAAQGRSTEAMAMYRRALEGHERVANQEHRVRAMERRISRLQQGAYL